jgi:hypothetical protein
MSTVHRLPVRRDLFLDQRGADRGLRVTCHPEEGVVVISLWHDDRCTASFRLPGEESARLISVLAAGLADQIGDLRAGSAFSGEPAQTADGG